MELTLKVMQKIIKLMVYAKTLIKPITKKYILKMIRKMDKEKKYLIMATNMKGNLKKRNITEMESLDIKMVAITKDNFKWVEKMD
jgi:hypothetical protein